MKSLRIRAILRSTGFIHVMDSGIYHNNNGYATSPGLEKELLNYETKKLGEKEAKRKLHNFLEESKLDWKNN